MIALSRRAARRFRAAARKCSDGRAAAPPVVIRSRADRVTLTAAYPDVTLEYECLAPADTPGSTDATLVVPMGVLDAVGGAGDDPVTFACGPKLTGTTCWTERAGERSVPVEFLLPGKQHDVLDRPTAMPGVSEGFLSALHEAGRTSSREDGRYALSRVQVRGQKGQVIATDGKVAVVYSGFTFPFAEDVLVPALALFGCPEVRDGYPVRVGRTAAHLVVTLGDWTAWLAVAPAGKFPDVAAVVPRRAPTTVALGDWDAVGLIGVLPTLPGQGHEHRPVTLDAVAGGVLVLHAADGTGARTVPCPNSPVQGPSARAVLDRRVLARALVLGCRTLHLTPGKAVAFAAADLTVVAAPLDPDMGTDAVPAPPAPCLITPVPQPELERSSAMKPHETNGTGRHDPPAEAADPLAAAEDLRAALADAAAKAGRLVATLKAGRKEKKALATVYAGLKQLNLNQP